MDGSRLCEVMALWTDHGESHPRVRSWLMELVSCLVGTGGLGAGVSSLDSLGVGVKRVG